jgi:uncharacterized protein (TIGR02145 family)
MKNLFTLLALAITIIASAQAPQGFNYQATVRNSSGALLLNQIVLVKFNVFQNSATGTLVYSENQSANTDDLGHIALVVGQGAATTGTFSNINWGSGSYYLSIELNTGTGYVDMGTTQLLSVPYALHANSSAISTPQNLTAVLNAGNNANNNKIINLGDPVNPKDAVNKDYVDAKILQLQNYINALPLTDIDGNNYLPVTICNQTWTKSNLNVSKYNDGTPIPQVSDPTAWAALTTGAWCYYGNTTTSGTTYGKLYNWYAVAGIYDAASLANPALRKKLAPTGWHIPSDAEWTTLINCLDTNSNGGNTLPNFASGKMKSTGTIQAGTGLWESPNTAATDESGFTGLPGGVRNYTSVPYQAIGFLAYWWSYSESNESQAWERWIDYSTSNAVRTYGAKKNGLSVRCVKN